MYASMKLACTPQCHPACTLDDNLKEHHPFITNCLLTCNRQPLNPCIQFNCPAVRTPERPTALRKMQRTNLATALRDKPMPPLRLQKHKAHANRMQTLNPKPHSLNLYAKAQTLNDTPLNTKPSSLSLKLAARHPGLASSTLTLNGMVSFPR